MPSGLQIWDQNASIILDTNTRTSVILGNLDISSNGNIYEPKLTNGTPFWLFKPLNYNIIVTPQIWISGGNTINWSSSAAFGGNLIFGVY